MTPEERRAVELGFWARIRETIRRARGWRHYTLEERLTVAMMSAANEGPRW